MHHEWKDLPWESQPYGESVALIDLQEGDTCANPFSTKGPMCGPSTVVFIDYGSHIQGHEHDLGWRPDA